jgi:hypothetical protein
MSETGSCPILQINGESVARLQVAMTLADGFPAKGYAIDKARNRFTGQLCVRVSMRGYVSHFTRMSWDQWDREIEPLRRT